jgi:putative addiction module component (TIGR02574 family)
MTMAKIKQEALALKPSQRLRLVQEIWDSLVAEPETVEIPEWHRKALDERLAAHERDPSGTISYAEAKRRVRAAINRKRKR